MTHYVMPKHEREVTDRGPGMLSKKQRQYLLGELNLTERYADPADAERTIRKRIRDRVYNSVLDMGLLFWHLPLDDQRQLTEKFLSNPDLPGAKQSINTSVNRALDWQLAFTFMNNLMRENEEQLYNTIESSIRDMRALRAYEYNDVLYDVDVKLTFSNERETPVEQAESEDMDVELTDYQQFMLELFKTLHHVEQEPPNEP